MDPKVHCKLYRDIGYVINAYILYYNFLFNNTHSDSLLQNSNTYSIKILLV